MRNNFADDLTALGIDADWLEPLQAVFDRYDMHTAQRQAAFVGQCAHESNNFKTLEENLNYSAAGLHATWPKRFPTLESAQAYHRQPESIANKVYANRMGNGDEASGEGWLYHGRGLIQLTGKTNYTLAGDALLADFIYSPDLILAPKYAALTAGWFWAKNDLNRLADTGNWEAVTRKINGGILGLEDRIARTTKALEVFA
jgi:putative chitinase